MVPGKKQLPRGRVRSSSKAPPLQSTAGVRITELLPLVNDSKDYNYLVYSTAERNIH